MGDTWWCEFTPDGVVIFHWQSANQKTSLHQFGHDIADRIGDLDRQCKEDHERKMEKLLRDILKEQPK